MSAGTSPPDLRPADERTALVQRLERKRLDDELERVAVEMYPEATVLPIMSTGATDMAQMRAKGVQSYGIGPARTIDEINSGFGAHGDSERVAEDAFVSMVEYLWRVILEMAASD